MEVKIKIDGKEYTIEEAKALYEKLRTLFDKEFVEYNPNVPIIKDPYDCRSGTARMNPV